MFLLKILITSILNFEIFVTISATLSSGESDSNEFDIDAEKVFSYSELGLLERINSRFRAESNEVESDDVDYSLIEKYQGDMILTADQKNVDKVESRNGLKDENYRWPKNATTGKVIVPYIISDEYCKYFIIKTRLIL